MVHLLLLVIVIVIVIVIVTVIVIVIVIVIFNSYLLQSDCAAVPVLASGIATNICLEGIDEENNLLGSIIYQLMSEDDNYIHYNKNVYSSSDCSGFANVTSMAAAKYCINVDANDDDNNNSTSPFKSVIGSYAAQDAWSKYSNGPVFK